MNNAPPRMSFTIDEALAATGLNRSALYGLLNRNEIRSFKVGKRRMVSARALGEFIEKKEKECGSGLPG